MIRSCPWNYLRLLLSLVPLAADDWFSQLTDEQLDLLQAARGALAAQREAATT